MVPSFVVIAKDFLTLRFDLSCTVNACSIWAEPSLSSIGTIRTVFADEPLRSGEFKQVKSAGFIRISLYYAFADGAYFVLRMVEVFFPPLHVYVYMYRQIAYCP